MNAVELLSELRARQVDLMVVGDRLRIRPAQALPPDLRAELRERQGEVVALLRSAQLPGVADAMPGGVTEATRSLLAADVVAMSLSQFARAGVVVTVHSALLDDTMVFASDNAQVDPGEQRVVYRAAELSELLGVAPDVLRSVHRTKKLFGGSVLSS